MLITRGSQTSTGNARNNYCNNYNNASNTNKTNQHKRAIQTQSAQNKPQTQQEQTDMSWWVQATSKRSCEDEHEKFQCRAYMFEMPGGCPHTYQKIALAARYTTITVFGVGGRYVWWIVMIIHRYIVWLMPGLECQNYLCCRKRSGHDGQDGNESKNSSPPKGQVTNGKEVFCSFPKPGAYSVGGGTPVAPISRTFGKVWTGRAAPSDPSRKQKMMLSSSCDKDSQHL